VNGLEKISLKWARRGAGKMTEEILSESATSENDSAPIWRSTPVMDVRRGEIVVLLGQTGAGKARADLIMGTTCPDSGRIRVAGFDPFASSSPKDGFRSASQTDRLLPWRTAVENVELDYSFSENQVTGTGARQEWLARVRLDAR